MKKLFKNIKLDRQEAIFLLIIVGTAAFFRFWHLAETQYLTYDQARDFLIIKRIIVDHRLTLLGTTVLIPGVYLPPFYYYSLIPFLVLFKFSPLGADVYTALLGVGTVLLFYLLTREFFNRLTAFLSSLIFATLPMIVVTSRHAWNPNTTFFYSLLFIFFVWRFLKEKRWLWFYSSVAVLSWGLSFHLGLIILAPLLLIVFLWAAKGSSKLVYKFFFSLVIFSLFLIPLFLFELRHGFLITSNILNFLGQQKSSQLTNRLASFLIDFFKMPLVLFVGHLIPGVKSVNPSHIILFDQLSILKINLSWEQTLYFSFSALITVLIFVASLITLFTRKLLSDKRIIFLFLTFFVSGISIRFLVPPESFYFYIYTFLFPAVLLLLANLINLLLKKKEGRIVVLIMVAIFLYSGVKEFNSLQPSQRSERFFQEPAKIIADDYFENVLGSYVVAVNNADPERWDHNGLEYRYFLEAYFHLPRSGWEAVDYQQAETLYLIDEGNLSEPLKLRGMEMEAFKPQKIVRTWQLANGDKIYKLKKE